MISYAKIEEISLNELDPSKLKWDVNNHTNGISLRAYLSDYDSPVRNRHIPHELSSGKTEGWFMGISLSKGSNGQKYGYLTISYVEVAEPKKGFGKILFKRALEELKKFGYKGIASERKFRSDMADNLWKKIVDFSDDRFDYVEKI